MTISETGRGRPTSSESLGYYEPPKSGQKRAPAYFFRDPEGQLPVEANLYHEVSHQLLFETAGPNAYTKNAGNYWVFEGLGTYFETVSPQDDGSLEVGGLVGRRIEAALNSLVDQKRRNSVGRVHRAGSAGVQEGQPADLSLLPASHGSGCLPDAVARRNLPRRIPGLRPRRLSGANQAKDRPVAPGSPRPTLRNARPPVPDVPGERPGGAERTTLPPAKSKSGGIRTVPNL